MAHILLVEDDSDIMRINQNFLEKRVIPYIVRIPFSRRHFCWRNAHRILFCLM